MIVFDCKGWIPASAGTTDGENGNDRQEEWERQMGRTGTTGNTNRNDIHT